MEYVISGRIWHSAVHFIWRSIIKVKNPVAVRYCFRDFKPGNVANLRELPMYPFRTDNWE
ncbi:hypothetical protein QVN91_12730 [Bacteroides caecigallinarum]|uniref:hypothetical protein n=1 Tax=Bacteroides caecigallinarum TaxID=1411144 RepID=UPI001F392051|nr:hypothetical protein [Bacteroides caecigallinarum]MCF2737514.1 hypothetical protein [Bacteroides caecigallinarum]MDN0053803.1 hypothetical protein [Bacteroides caecigallinarum]MDN0073050.1 hypothetical protein [Bacteroides caecigallinarum]